MTAERLLFYLHQRPFIPFTIHVADGTEIDVKSPEFLTARVVKEGNREGVRTIEVHNTETNRAEIVDLLLVTRLSTASDSF